MKTTSFVSALLATSLARAQSGTWQQYGGINYSGPKGCSSGNVCTAVNDYYHQCVPVTTLTTFTTEPPAAPPSTATTVSTLVPSPSTSTGTDTCPTLPSGLGQADSKLPDPFTFANGAKVQLRTDWTCRQREMSFQLQAYELGSLPPAPQSVTASYSGNVLSITVSDNGRSITFSVTIKKPAGSNVPAIIAYGFASIPIPSEVATITFNNDDIAAQQGGSSRGQGKFYTLYGASHSAGAMTAWAWGVARIIDALERVPSIGIDPTRVGVTGCSRNGKGAMVAGALEPRIALTLPQESGSGGSACWRLSDWQRSRGDNVQTASQIVGENVWLSPSFNSRVSNVNSLPFDHHSLAGLVSPRPIYIMENSDMEWLGRTSTYGCMGAARTQWAALGALDKFGYSQVGGNSHCSFPSAKQGGELTAFISKFLLGKNAGTTSIFRTEATHTGFDLAAWAPWPVPNLT